MFNLFIVFQGVGQAFGHPFQVVDGAEAQTRPLEEPDLILAQGQDEELIAPQEGQERLEVKTVGHHHQGLELAGSW